MHSVIWIFFMDIRDNMINRFELWMLKRIIRKTLRQGYHHEKLTSLYHMIFLYAEIEFFEDTDATLKNFLEECFKEGMNG